jgi:hypothetical protein
MTSSKEFGKKGAWADKSVVMTDAVLAVASAVAALVCARSALGLVAAIAFTLLAVCAILGSVYHAYRLCWQPRAIQILWSLIVACTCLFAMVLALAVWLRAGGYVPLIVVICGIVIALGFGYWGGLADSFLPASITSVVCVVGTLYVLLKPWAAGQVWAENMLIGVLVSVAASGIQATNWRKGKEWNHNDVYHAVQLLALYPMVLAFK